MEKHNYKTVIVSDIHLGSRFAKVRQISDFLASINCERLIFNGDTIDGWRIIKNNFKCWSDEYVQFIKCVLSMMQERGTIVNLLKGNHDDLFSKITPIRVGGLDIINDMVLTSGDKRYFVTHGDIFDSISCKMRWMAKLGDFLYNLLLKVNGFHNELRSRRGKSGCSYSQKVKAKVKSWVSNLSDFENKLADMARSKGCDGIICGHIHTAKDQIINGIHYLNSGDWVETLSALVEDFDGNWKILYYSDMFSNA